MKIVKLFHLNMSCLYLVCVFWSFYFHISATFLLELVNLNSSFFHWGGLCQGLEPVQGWRTETPTMSCGTDATSWNPVVKTWPRSLWQRLNQTQSFPDFIQANMKYTSCGSQLVWEQVLFFVRIQLLKNKAEAESLIYKDIWLQGTEWYIPYHLLNHVFWINFREHFHILFINR